MTLIVKLLVLLGCLISACPSWAQCGFAIRPAADERWFLDTGWKTPGVVQAKRFAPVHFVVNGKPVQWAWPDGVTASIAVFELHNDAVFPDVVFPEAVFTVLGQKRRMLSGKFYLYRLVRWEMNGRVYAYSYELGPYDVACTASIDLIDDRGDGKFRILVPYGHTLMVPPRHQPEPPPLPNWLSKPAS